MEHRFIVDPKMIGRGGALKYFVCPECGAKATSPARRTPPAFSMLDNALYRCDLQTVKLVMLS